MSRWAALGWAGLVLLVSCTDGDGGGRAAAPILSAFGTDDIDFPPGTDASLGDGGASGPRLSGGRFPAVVLINAPHGNCTGTLISPSHVLTAGHCVVGGGGGVAFEIAFGFHPEEFSFTDTAGVTHIDMAPLSLLDTRNASICAVHPAFQGGNRCGELFEPGAGANIHREHDVAILTLDRPVPPAWVPDRFGADHHRLISDAEVARIGLSDTSAVPVTMVGYGLDQVTARSTARPARSFRVPGSTTASSRPTTCTRTRRTVLRSASSFQ